MNFLRLHQYLPGPWLIALIMVICFFAFSIRQQNDTPANDYDSISFPQYYMKSVETREYDPQGKLRYQLITPRVTHHQALPDAASAKDYTLFEQPEMHFYDVDPDNKPWHVTADTGRSETNGQLIRLLNNVVIQQQTDSNGLIRITTTELNLHTNTQFAQTDKAVNIRSAKGQMNALGMEADLAKSWLTLKSQVKAVYEPH
jgi:lipopolysaccharide export system protein LptC